MRHYLGNCLEETKKTMNTTFNRAVVRALELESQTNLFGPSAVG